MTLAPCAAARRRFRPWLFLLAVPLLGVGCVDRSAPPAPPVPSGLEPVNTPLGRPAVEAPDLDGGVAWLNTAGPIHLKDLRGKIVILDFWTLCCINCIHTIPDLARLEKKYPNELVVIGIHTPKFDSERDTENIRKAILRYEVAHPVVNDADRKIWDAYDVDAWPTIILIDPEGKALGKASGEGLYDLLDAKIAEQIKIGKEKKTLNERPLKFEQARTVENGRSPLFFPGKVLVDAPSKRVFIADSTHHRIVVTDLDGNKVDIAGTGAAGKDDGPFDKATFNDPQGMALHNSVLYVADRKNHMIRAVDLRQRTVQAVAGTGEQSRDFEQGDEVQPLKVGLNSPWDLYLQGDQLYIAMAGRHQIWLFDLKKNEISRFAGQGAEDIKDGPLPKARFAQPSGLASDGTTLYVADSEVSAIRAVPLNGRGEVRTLVGVGLFKFGDVDGIGEEVRLQHALGVACHDGKVYIADTYNSKIKVLDPDKRTCTTFLGGSADGWLGMPPLNEPGGICYADGKLYLADTNAHRIRVVDLRTKAISTLELKGVEAPKMP